MKKLTTLFAAMPAFVFLAVVLLSGCSTPPSAFEDYLFDRQTNFVSVVSEVATTNATTGAVVVNVQTNILPTITQTPSVALQSWAGLASGVANTVSPGSGGIVGIALLGVAGLFGLNRQRKLTQVTRESAGHAEAASTSQAVAENFAQSIEVMREVLKRTPQGQALNVKIVDMLQRNQMSVGIIEDAAEIVAATVDNDKAKRAAQMILETIRSSTTPQTGA